MKKKLILIATVLGLGLGVANTAKAGYISCSGYGNNFTCFYF